MGSLLGVGSGRSPENVTLESVSIQIQTLCTTRAIPRSNPRQPPGNRSLPQGLMLDRPWDRGMGTHSHWGRSSTTDMVLGLSLPVCAEREAEACLLELRQPPLWRGFSSIPLRGAGSLSLGHPRTSLEHPPHGTAVGHKCAFICQRLRAGGVLFISKSPGRAPRDWSANGAGGKARQRGRKEEKHDKIKSYIRGEERWVGRVRGAGI